MSSLDLADVVLSLSGAAAVGPLASGGTVDLGAILAVHVFGDTGAPVGEANGSTSSPGDGSVNPNIGRLGDDIGEAYRPIDDSDGRS